MKTVTSHPRDRLGRRLKNVPANIVSDEEFLKELPYFNKKLRVKRREAIFDKILKQMGPENDKYYVKYNQDLDTLYWKRWESYCYRELRWRGRTEKATKKKVNN